MKKIIYLLTFSCFISATSNSQGINWEWERFGGAADFGGADNWGAAADDSGVYVCGTLGGTIYWPDGVSIGNPYTTTFYVARYDKQGNFKWAQGEGNEQDIGGCWASGVVTDVSGNAYVAGYFGARWFSLGAVTLSNTSTQVQLFLAKYDRNGNVIWAKSSSSSASGYAKSSNIAFDGNNGIYVTGQLRDTIQLGNFTLAETASGNDMFLAKFDTLGNVIWATAFGGNNYYNDVPLSLVADAAGNVYVTGTFESSSISFGNITVNSSVYSGFIARFDNTGSPVWAKATGTKAVSNAIAIDRYDNIYQAGGFLSDSIVFDAVTLSNALYPSNGRSMFLTKYNSAGNVMWAKTAIGAGSNVGWNLTVTRDDVMYLTGGFDSTTFRFDTITLTVPPPGLTDPMFMLTLDLDGNILCAAALTSGGDDNSQIAVSPTNDVYLAGDYAVNNFAIDTAVAQLQGSEQFFLAKFSCGNLPAQISEVFPTPTLQLSPNPTTTQTTITYNFTNSPQNTTLVLYDIYGRQINQYKLTQAQGALTLNTQTLSSGVYLCALVEDGRVAVTKRLVVEK